MTGAANGDWRDMFVGRDQELAQIKAAWHQAKSREPQVVSLVAESGLGKTRLVQEFFAWLSTTQDGEADKGYWPDELTRVHNRRARRELLTLNPDPADCARDGRSIPFFWWAIQLPDCQDDPNRVVTSLSQYEYRLKLHLLAYLNAVRVAELKREHAKSGGGTAFDLGLNVAGEILPQVILSAIPGGSLAFTLLSSMIDMGKWGYETAKRQQDINAMGAPLAPDEALAEKRHDITQTILANLNTVCNAPPEPLEPVPLVLVIDDAQWIAGDLSLCKLVSDLLALAGEHRWPLLLIVTSWETEWHAATPIDWTTDRRGSIRDIFMHPQVKLQEVRLQPIAEFDTIVGAAFPGLLPEQRKMVVDKAEGNALCLYDILHHMGERQQFFIDRNPHNALTSEGAESLRAAAFEDIIWARINSAPEHVQTALGLASLQGMRFSERLVTTAAQQLALARAEEGLAEGEKPYAFVARQNSDAGEFRARYYQRIAQENLDNHVDRGAAESAVASALSALSEGSIGEGLEEEELWLAQLALFASDNPAHGTVAYTALYNLSARAYVQKDYLASLSYAQQWAGHWLAGRPGSSGMAQMLWLAQILSDLGDADLALGFCENLIGYCRTNLKNSKDGTSGVSVAVSERELCQALERTASSLWQLGRYQETYAYYWEAHELRAQRYASDQAPDNLLGLAASASQLAAVTVQTSGSSAALSWYERAIKLAEEYTQLVPGQLANLLLADGLGAYARTIQSAGRLSDALPYFRRAVDILNGENIAADDRHGLFKHAHTTEIFSTALMDAHNYVEAAAVARDSLRSYKQLDGLWPLPRYRPSIRRQLLTISDCARLTGDTAGAQAAFNEGLALAIEDYEATESLAALLDVTLFFERAYDVASLVSPASAFEVLAQLLEGKRELVSLDPSFHSNADLGYILAKSCEGYIATGRANETAPLLEELGGVIEQLRQRAVSAHDQLRLAYCLFKMGDLLRITGRDAETDKWLEEAMERALPASAQLQSNYAKRIVSLVLEGFAALATHRNQPELGLSYLLACMEIKQEIAQTSADFETFNDRAIVGVKIGDLLSSLGDHGQASHYYAAALDARLAQEKLKLAPPGSVEAVRAKHIQAEQLHGTGNTSPVDIAPWRFGEKPRSSDVPAPTSRNADCPCGSGKRYKHCHGAISGG